MDKTKNKTDRKVIHTKEEKFDNNVRVLQLMIENKGKSFTNRDIRQRFYGDESKEISIKSMFQKIIDNYVICGILIRVTNIKDKNQNEKEVILNIDDYDDERKIYEVKFENKRHIVKLTDVRIRLYDKNFDSIDENGEFYDDDYVVDLQIPKSRDGIFNLCQTVSSMIMAIPNVDIYTPIVKTTFESNRFGLQRLFVTQTIGKVILKHHNIMNEMNSTNGYPLDVLYSIIKSKINVNVKFDNNGNTIELKNTKVERITIKEKGFDIHFNNLISQNHTDINQILSIENVSENGLIDDMKKVKELINDLPIEEKNKIENLIDELSSIMTICFM